MDYYRSRILGISDKGTFSYGGKDIFYGHILPEDVKELNILDYKGIRYDLHENDIKPHRFFHHLNSSQAMCINFFYPLIMEDKLDLVGRILGLDGKIKASEFEKESSIENIGRMRRTFFDFYIETDEGKKIYFEIKYTENEFGSVKHSVYSNDYRYKDKFNTVYKPKMQSNDVINTDYQNMEDFFKYYQIMRNLINIDNDSYVVFVYPKGNKTIEEGALLARDSLVEDKWRNHFIIITWEELLNGILSFNKNKDLEDYYANMFKVKYLA
jgi:hypothetical protein